MKYGQQFASALSASSQEFQQASIDYKQLKKSIKRIEKELQALGLNAQVLKELLSADTTADTPDEQDNLNSNEVHSATSGINGNGSPTTYIRKSPSRKSLHKAADGSIMPPPINGKGKAAAARRRNRRQSRARAEYELAGTAENPIPRIKLVFSSESSASESSSDEDANTSNNTRQLYKRILQADSAQIVELDDSSAASTSKREEPVIRKPNGKAPLLASAEQITSEEEAELQSSGGHSDSHNDSEVEEGDSQAEAVDIENGEETNKLISKMYGHGIVPDSQVTPPGSPNTIRQSLFPSSENGNDVEDTEEIIMHGPDVLLEASQSDSSGHDGTDQDGDGDGDVEDNPQEVQRRPASYTHSRQNSHASNLTLRDQHRLTKHSDTTRRRPRRHRREVVINLAYDSEFFLLLNQALTSLTTLMSAEKAIFMESVKALADIVSNTSSPSKNKNDLYAWRAVFSLWIEAQIFESGRESDRGERAILEIEKRLNWFVDQIGRRKLAKKMKSKESRKALEKFVKLNQELLQLKRIGLANQEAARKILKKHDKRLGLSASQDFPGFIAEQQHHSTDGTNSLTIQDPLSPSSASSNAMVQLAKRANSSEMSSLVFIGLTTLPHALLAMFTDILLPIIPQIDDYACLICGDIAWRPIALDCGHHFCVRCLVKMQKREQDACPACRAPVVMKASKENLDNALIAFQKRWFPKEVKQKGKDDTREIEKEIAEELEMSGKCVLM